MILKLKVSETLHELITKYDRYLPKADLFFKNHIRRYNLSKEDRFLVMDLFYYYLRHRFLILQASEDLSRSVVEVLWTYYTQELDDKLVQWQAGLERDEYLRLLLSVDSWWYQQLARFFNESQMKDLQEYLQSRAPTTLLVLLKRNSVDTLKSALIAAGLEVRSLLMPSALEVTGRLRNHEHLFFDVQDHSSQLMSLLAPVNLSRMLDYCAGYGGKSIAFATLWPNLEIVASDIRDELQESVQERAKRAGIKLRWRRKRELMNQLFPFVVVDAPCSGSGVWRRNPEDRYRFGQKEVEKLSQTQLAILLEAGKLVAPGGELLYITCSISVMENEEVIRQFLAKTKQFTQMDIIPRLRESAMHFMLDYADLIQYLDQGALPFLRIKPQLGGGDLFFACLLKKNS